MHLEIDHDAVSFYFKKLSTINTAEELSEKISNMV